MSIFVNESEAKSALEALRNDSTNTDWVLVGYTESSNEQVVVLGSGEGGFSALSAKLQDDEVAYAVLGLSIVDEGVSSVKYIFINWVGKDVKPLQKGRSSQHRLPIYKFANTVLQLGGEYQALTREELTEDLLKQKLAGTKFLTDQQADNVLKSKGVATSEKFQFENEEATKTAIQNVRSKNETLWVAFGYDSGKEEAVKILKTGSGGVDSWMDLLKDNEVIYVLAGVNPDVSDYATQIKYILVTWVGPEVTPLHKARSSQHRVAIYNYAKVLLQLAGEAQFLIKSEITDAALLEKLSGATDAKSEEELRKAADIDAKKKAQPTAEKKKEEDFKTPLADEAGVKALFEPVAKNQSDLNYAVFGYDADVKKENPVILTHKGTGGLDEVLPLLKDNEVTYIVLGHLASEAASEYSTLKFIFITWVGPGVKPLHKARSSQHRVAIYNFINKTLSLAGEVQVLNKEELTLTLLSQKLTGSKLEEAPTARTAPRSPTAARKEKEQLTIDNEEGAKQALKDINSGASVWTVFTPTTKADTLGVVASGKGSVDELKEHFKDDGIAFGVISVTSLDSESGEDYKTVKNIFISWVGPEVKPLLKARSSQLRLGLYNYIKNILTLHGELQVLTSSDLTEELLHQKYTGSKQL